MSDSETDGEPTNGGTTDEEYRWKWLSTAMAAFVTLAYWALIYLTALDYAYLGAAQWSVLTLSWLTALAYACGTDTFRAVQKARGKV